MLDKIAIPFSPTYSEDILEKHKRHKIIIKKYIEEFKNTNNLNNKDFVIIGSSCASYMDYIILRNVRDIDIYLLDKDLYEKCLITKRVDLIQHILLPSDFTDRLVEKDGYYFLSEKDFLMNVCCGGLYKLKSKDILYTKTMLAKLNISCDDIYNTMQNILPVLKESINYPPATDKISSRLHLIKKYCSDNELEKIKAIEL